MARQRIKKNGHETKSRIEQRHPDTSEYLNYKIGREDDLFVRLQMILGKSKKEITEMIEKL